MKARHIASMLRQLYAAGWTIDMVYAAGGPAPAQQWRITSGKVERCYGKTVESVTDLHGSLAYGAEFIDPGPLLDRILFHHDGRIVSVMDEADRRMFYRLLEADGQEGINVFVADRWCHQYLGLHLYEIYPVTSDHWRQHEASTRSAA